MAAGTTTDYAGLAIAGAVVIGGYLLYSSGALNRLLAGVGQPVTAAQPLPGGGYCADGSSVSPQTGLCANGAAPTTIPVANPYTQQQQMGPGGPGMPCTGQDYYTGQPCSCIPPMTSSAMMYGQQLAYQPSTPTCNCSMCGQQTGGYGQNPYGQQYNPLTGQYGSPYGSNPYANMPGSGYPPQYGSQYPYGSPYGQQQQGGGYGLGGFPYQPTYSPIGMPGSPGYPSPYPYPQYPGAIGGGIGGYPSPYSPYPPSPYSPYPIVSPYPTLIGSPGLPGLPGIGGGGGGGGGGILGIGGIGGIGGFPIRRYGYLGESSSDLNSYAGKAIAQDSWGLR